jgi:membrane protein
MPTLRSAVAFLPRLVARVRDVDLFGTAASLSYTTLLGLVPLATVAFVFVARFPFFSRWLDAFETYLLKHVLPGSAANVVRTHVVGLAEKAAQLTGASVFFLAIAAMLLIATVEREFNLIWGVPQRRPLHRRIAVYLFGLTLGPVLVGASISLTSWLVSRSLEALPIDEGPATFVARWLPFVFTAVALTLLYAIVPARRVPIAPAMVAGVVAALAFEGAKHAFAWYVTHLSNYQLVYGALAALPVFMLWIYLSWLIVLAGAAVSATLALPARTSGARR